VPQFLVSNFHGPWLVDVIASVVSMGSLVLFLKVWQPSRIWTSPALTGHPNDGALLPASLGAAANPDYPSPPAARYDTGTVFKAWLPWIILSLFVFIWGIESFKAPLNKLFFLKWEVEGLHNLVQKVPPVVVKPSIEAAVYNFNLLSMTGTGILLAAIVSGVVMGYGPWQLIKAYGRTLLVVRNSLLTIATMLALGTLTRFSGLDATLGLAFAGTGFFYPFFAALLGWLGVALTGSDTASNVLFGGLQKVTAEQLGLSSILMTATNSSGGVMGKMIDAQSIVVASTATNWFGHEGTILRFVFRHSIALACLVGLFVMLQAYVFPFTKLVIH